jgi:hypothetical protein
MSKQNFLDQNKHDICPKIINYVKLGEILVQAAADLQPQYALTIPDNAQVSCSFSSTQ